ncbi:hypothetical protein D9615_001715 [Tricholomella constricta]|uniref:Outer spore wall protein RRT8 n=1 Tax=Tricholomella constricta TaxID=117010 RepID=A0A8H5MA41_9AGAR|nr:hypothetical protein D9615_001715 [Tricholomella constricta]
MSRIANTTKSVLLEKFTETATLSRDAATSGGWSYPLLGIVYFVSHPSLYRAVAPIIIKCIISALGITIGLFVFTYIPQVAFCALFSGPFAFITAAVMVLGEAYAIILVLSKLLFVGQAQDEIFDAVLLQQGNEQLVSRGREVRSSSGIKKLGKSITLAKPLSRFSMKGILRYIISLPLNSLPIVGTIMFFLYNGVEAGPGFHTRYFQLKGFDASTRQSFVEKRRGAYTAFGATALALNVVPIIGLAFGFTSTVGAALWASQLEKKYGLTKESGHVGAAQRLPEDEVRVEL